MFTWPLKPNKIPKHRLIWWRNVGSLTFFACICFVMAPKSRYLKSVNHKIVTWSTNRPRRLYFTIFLNLLFLYFTIFSLNCTIFAVTCFRQIISLFLRTILYGSVLGPLKPNKIPKHRLIWRRNVGSLTFFVCICFVMAPKSRYLKLVNHKIVTWNTNRPRKLYFTIFFNLLFLYFPIFSLNCIYCHLFSNSR